MRWVTGAAGLILWMAGAGSALAQESLSGGERELEWLVARLRASGSLVVEGETVHASEVTIGVYERRGYAPLWSSRDLAALLSAVASADEDGLDPELYYRSTLEEMRISGAAAARPAETDLLATDALVRLSHDLRFGRVRPSGPNGYSTGASPFGGADAVSDVIDAVASGDLVDRLAALRPAHFIYDGLREGLARLREVSHDGGWRTIPPGPTMQRDSLDLRVSLLRRRLIRSGDLDPSRVPPAGGLETHRFDGALEEAVRAFQHRHGLNEDGRVGARTLEELNVPVERRIDQLRVNLERARWVAHELPDTFVAVNVAGARVYVLRSGKVVFETRAIVGRDRTRTPVFSAPMRYIDLNPTWTVPSGIVDEVLEAIRADPGYLEARVMHVLDAEGRPVDPATLDFRTLRSENFPYVLRQDPGPKNPLGRLKLMFPNAHNVYLHDSPDRSLFVREGRLFSHGCIRVQDPLGLAVEVLDDQETWSRQALEAAIADGETRTIQLTHPLMVFVLYWTAAADGDGVVHYYRDVYDRDPEVLSALDRR